MLDDAILGRITFFTTCLVTLLYSAVGACYLLKKDYAWCMVWISYALANVGLILIGLRGNDYEKQEQQKVYEERTEKKAEEASEGTE